MWGAGGHPLSPRIYTKSYTFCRVKDVNQFGRASRDRAGRYLWGEFASTLVGTLGITRGVKDFGRAFKDYQYILGVARGGLVIYIIQSD